MSLVRLELKEEHIKLLKHLRWSIKDNVIQGVSDDEDSVPFGENSIYEAIDLILNGMPENFDPFETEELPEYSNEQKKEWFQLYSELPLALEVLAFFDFKAELGKYKTKFHDRNWKKEK